MLCSTAAEGRSVCDYTEGRWVRDPGHARRYNATECNVTSSVNCFRNGRPDTGYLDWRWKPAAPGCHLPAFDAAPFLAAVCGKHVAFVGDSMARNQAESLVCLLSSSSCTTRCPQVPALGVPVAQRDGVLLLVLGAVPRRLITSSGQSQRTVVVATVSPAHFEKARDDLSRSQGGGG
ncbi:hypothetical protein PR202_ga17623 [Eleusine coracana subsp. coracana]|uniref:Trichome birefringence-like N-terminal domain-containing protein n=1 Tax=Eleusine coracana subsp. coracana TaxID=191504 RepID=A0AAV5CQV9_ELECO|nr:hypothetical protein PR202_ga17376 [Eleusine coracana subsp. coracana]GJN00441.1 hypothetical protein PR202_ga17623 [Eleusine coracana subsp. coracana]